MYIVRLLLRLPTLLVLALITGGGAMYVHHLAPDTNVQTEMIELIDKNGTVINVSDTTTEHEKLREIDPSLWYSYTEARPWMIASDAVELAPDSVNAGGGDDRRSSNLILKSTLGEAFVQAGQSEQLKLQAGYRQAAQSTVSINCGGFPVTLGNVTIGGTSTGSGSCTITTDNPDGYSLAWRVTTGSGGAQTGHMISQFEEIIPRYYPTVADTPETWTVGASTSAWGARLSSESTDTAAEWGVDATSEKWLNVGTGSTRTIASRGSLTPTGGSIQILDIRAGIGASYLQPTGTYEVTIQLTASTH